MHEILAPLIFVIHCDHQTYLFAQENGLVELVYCSDKHLCANYNLQFVLPTEMKFKNYLMPSI